MTSAHTRHCGAPRDPRRLRALPALLMSAGLVAPVAHAGPEGGVVSAGRAAISQSGERTRIDQRSERAIIDWRGFDVGATESVRFHQPSSRSATLNRVGGGGPSRIDGQLQANGQVFIVNQAGVIFGRSASVNVAGLLATTSNISSQDFLAGRLAFAGDGGAAGELRNEGSLTAADGGFIALVGPQVRNDGTITARLGRVALASGDRFTVDLAGDQLIRFALSEQDTRALEHSGAIAADGGSVLLLSAAQARRVVGDVINLGGIVRARTVEQHEGRIILGAPGATAEVSASLDVRGLEPGSHGGEIDLRAAALDLQGARLDASGDGGGGRIHVGGDWQGGGDGPRAEQVRVSADTRLSADALARGDGGEVVVWADGDTRFEGRIDARGGPRGGDGGRVEVSGKQNLAFDGSVDAGAPHGRAGLLLLDPLDLLIAARDAGNISRILRSGTSLQLQADRDIAINAPIDGRGGASGAGLSLDAGRNIAINDFIVTAGGAVELLASTGSVSFAEGKAVFTGSAPIRVTAGGLLSSGVLLTSGTVTLRSTAGDVHIDGVVDPTNGALQVDAAGNVQVNAPILNLRSGADVDIVAGGDVALNAQLNGLDATRPGGQVTVTAGGDVTVGDFIVTADGAVAIQAGGSLGFAPGKAIFSGSAPIALSSVGALDAGSTVTSGDVALASSGGNVRLGAAVEPDNGDLTVTAAGDIQVDAPVVNLLSGSSVDMRAGGDIEVNEEINGTGASVPGGSIALEAGGELRIADHVASQDGAIRLQAGGAVVQSPDAIVSSGSAPLTIVSGAKLTTGALLSSGPVSLESTGDVDLAGVISESNGDLSVVSGGDVRVLAPIANLRSGAQLEIRAGGDLTVSAQIDGLGASGVGDVQLRADGDILLERFVATRSAPILVEAGGDITLLATGGAYSELATIRLLAGGDLVQGGAVQSPAAVSLVSSGGTVTLAAGLAPGGPVDVSAATDLRVTSTLNSLAGGRGLTLSAGRNVFIDGQIDGRGGIAGGSLAIDAGGTLAVSRPIVTNNGAILIHADGSASFAPAATVLAGTGRIDVSAGGSLSTAAVASSGAVSLVASGGALGVGGTVSGGSVGLRAGTSLSIQRSVVASGALDATAGGGLTVSAPIQGGTVSLQGGSVAINADVVAGTSLGVSGGSVSFGGGGLFSNGSLSLSSGGNLTTGTLSAGSGLSISSGGNLIVTQAVGGLGGGISYSAGGDLTLAAAIADLGGSASLSAGGDVIIDQRIDGIDGAVTITAGGDARLNNHIVTNNAAISVAAGGTIVHAGNGVDAFLAPQSFQLRAGSASISETAGATLDTGSMITSGAVSVTSTGGDINVNVPIYETTGFTQLSAAGDININQVIANATTGADLVLSAGGDININAKVGPWDRTDATFPVIGRDALPGGDITMTAAGNINIGAEVATYRGALTDDVARLSLTSTAGSVDFSAPNLRVMSDSGAVSISAFNDFSNGPTLADVNATPTAGYYTTGQLSLASTGGDVSIDSLIPYSTGSVLISAADQVRVNQRIYTDNGDITIQAGAGGIVQNTTADPNPDGFANTGFISDIDSGLGNLTLEAVGDILPTLLRTRGTLTVKSTAGAITGGQVDISRHVDPQTLVLTTLGAPTLTELAGFTGISGFQAKGSSNLSAISAGGSITNLGFFAPSTLLLIAAQDIVNPATLLGTTSRMFAGRDIVLDEAINFSSLEARAGRHLSVAAGGVDQHVAWGGSMLLSAGSDPFAGLGATTVAGVAAPAWGGAAGPGNITLGDGDDIVWLAGDGGLVASATGDITLPKLHVSWFISQAAQTLDARQLTQPLTLTADGNISVVQVETTGPVSMTSTGGNITLDSTIGAHVTIQAAADNLWNPNDLAVASLLLQADNGNIDMHEARAVGDITIAAPNGQVTLIGGTGIQGATVSVTDSDGVVFTNTISAATVPRLAGPSLVFPAVSPGPTNVGPGAPAVPGALPPVAPGGISVTMASASPVGASVAAPGQSGIAGAQPGSVDGSAGGLPPGSGVDSSQAPGGGDGFGEIFVAEADQGVTETRDPVRVETRQDSGEDATGSTGQGDGDAPGGGNEATSTADADAQPESGEPGIAPLAQADEGTGTATQDDEDEEKKKKARQAARQGAPVVVFAGGRGNARERDFGHGLPFEDGRVRP